MGTPHHRAGRLEVGRGTSRQFRGVPYVTSPIVARHLGYGIATINNWLTHPQKFTAGSILRHITEENGTRWFEWSSVKEAKEAIRRHGRFRQVA